MAILDTIKNIKTHLEDAYGMAEEKGATITGNRNLENLANTIESISGGGDISDYFTDTITYGTSAKSGWLNTIKKFPTFSFSGTNASYMFYQFPQINIDLKNIDTSNCNNMNYMFSYCKAPTLDVSKLKTDKCTNMSYMFNNCTSKLIGYENFNTSKVTTFQNAFNNGTCLYGVVDLSNWNFQANTYSNSLYGLFSNQTNMTKLIMPRIDANSNTTLRTVQNICSSCSNLLEVDMSSFYGDMKTLTSAFSGCSKLKKIDIRNMTLSTATSYSNMLSNVPKDCLIIVKDATEKTWLKGKFADYNIVTPEETGIYNEVEYIQNVSKSYIDTEYLFGSNTDFEIKFDVTGSYNQYQQYFAGPANAQYCPKLFQDKYSSKTELHIQANNSIIINQPTSMTIKVEGNKAYLNGNEIGNVERNVGKNTKSHYIFTAHEELDLYSYMRLYYLKVWENGELVREYVPVKNVNNFAYIYEKMENKIYSNLGTGTFDYGEK